MTDYWRDETYKATNGIGLHAKYTKGCVENLDKDSDTYRFDVCALLVSGFGRYVSAQTRFHSPHQGWGTNFLGKNAKMEMYASTKEIIHSLNTLSRNVAILELDDYRWHNFRCWVDSNFDWQSNMALGYVSRWKNLKDKLVEPEKDYTVDGKLVEEHVAQQMLLGWEYLRRAVMMMYGGGMLRKWSVELADAQSHGTNPGNMWDFKSSVDRESYGELVKGVQRHPWHSFAHYVLNPLIEEVWQIADSTEFIKYPGWWVGNCGKIQTEFTEPERV